MRLSSLRLLPALPAILLALASASRGGEPPWPHGVVRPDGLVWRDRQSHALASWPLKVATTPPWPYPAAAPEDPLYRVAAVASFRRRQILGTPVDDVLFRHATNHDFLLYSYDELGGGSWNKGPPAAWPALVGPEWRVVGACVFPQGNVAGLLLRHVTSHALVAQETETPYQRYHVKNPPGGQWRVVDAASNDDVVVFVFQDRSSRHLEVWQMGGPSEEGGLMWVEAAGVWTTATAPGAEWEPFRAVLSGDHLVVLARNVNSHAIQAWAYPKCPPGPLARSEAVYLNAPPALWAFQPEER